MSLKQVLVSLNDSPLISGRVMSALWRRVRPADLSVERDVSEIRGLFRDPPKSYRIQSPVRLREPEPRADPRVKRAGAQDSSHTATPKLPTRGASNSRTKERSAQRGGLPGSGLDDVLDGPVRAAAGESNDVAADSGGSEAEAYRCGRTYGHYTDDTAHLCEYVPGDGSCFKPAFIFNIPSNYVAPTDSDSREETLEFIWATYYGYRDANRRYTFAELEARYIYDTASWDSLTTTGRFWNSDGWRARDQMFFLHALACVDYFRGDIVPRDQCPDIDVDVCYGFSETIERGRKRLYRFGFDDGQHFDSQSWVKYEEKSHLAHGRNPWASCRRNPRGFPTGIHFQRGFAAGTTNSITNYVRFSAPWLSTLAEAADGWLYFANTLFWMAMEGVSDAWTSLKYLNQAIELGRLALTAITEFSLAILHELCHVVLNRSGDAGHCGTSCCPNAVPFEWRCLVASRLALPAYDNDGKFNLSMSSLEVDPVNNYFWTASSCGGGDYEADCRSGSLGVELPGAQVLFEESVPRGCQ